MDHIRIDEGIPRKKRLRAQARNQPKSAVGQFLSRYTLEQRTRIIQSVPAALLSGKTTSQLAQEHGIPPSTLKSWIVGDESVENARGAFLAAELTQRCEDIDTAPDPLALARAREGFRAWSWIAERRESRLYGQKQELTVTVQPKLTITTQAPLEGEFSTLPAQSTDK